MGKASRRRRDKYQRLQTLRKTVTPNIDGLTVDAVKEAFALVTAIATQPNEATDIVLRLSDDALRGGIVEIMLIDQFIVSSCKDLAQVNETTVTNEFDRITDALTIEAPDPVFEREWDRVLQKARVYAEMVDGAIDPDEIDYKTAADFTTGYSAVARLVTLTRLAHFFLTERCSAFEEDIVSYLSASAPEVEAHGNEIDAAAVDEYLRSVIEARLAADPAILRRAADALRNGDLELFDEVEDEVEEYGGADRLEELIGVETDEFDFEDLRLVMLVLLKDVVVHPEGRTVEDRLDIRWRVLGA